jgi:hypothetical protein
VSKFAGGLAQADYMSRIGQLPPQQCLVVPIDVGKRSATALVVDHHGRIVQDLFEFDLTVSGANKLITVVAAAEQRAGALSVRAGIESAGHYHRALATTLRGKGFDIVELKCCWPPSPSRPPPTIQRPMRTLRGCARRR